MTNTQRIYVDGSGGHTQGGWGSYGGAHSTSNQSGAVSGKSNSTRAELTAIEHTTRSSMNNSGRTEIHTDFKQAAGAHNSGYKSASSHGPNSDVYARIQSNVSNAKGDISVHYTPKGAGHSKAHAMASKGAK